MILDIFNEGGEGWSHNFLPPRAHKLSEILEICTIVRNIRDMLKMVRIFVKYFLDFFFWNMKVKSEDGLLTLPIGR